MPIAYYAHYNAGLWIFVLLGKELIEKYFFLEAIAHKQYNIYEHLAKILINHLGSFPVTISFSSFPLIASPFSLKDQLSWLPVYLLL